MESENNYTSGEAKMNLTNKQFETLVILVVACALLLGALNWQTMDVVKYQQEKYQSIQKTSDPLEAEKLAQEIRTVLNKEDLWVDAELSNESLNSVVHGVYVRHYAEIYNRFRDGVEMTKERHIADEVMILTAIEQKKLRFEELGTTQLKFKELMNSVSTNH
jgi:putative NIF3 family GTP cyclohydrolase 1 type 2